MQGRSPKNTRRKCNFLTICIEITRHLRKQVNFSRSGRKKMFDSFKRLIENRFFSHFLLPLGSLKAGRFERVSLTANSQPIVTWFWFFLASKIKKQNQILHKLSWPIYLKFESPKCSCATIFWQDFFTVFDRFLWDTGPILWKFRFSVFIFLLMIYIFYFWNQEESVLFLQSLC